MDNASKFIDSFVRIEKKLKEIADANRYLKFSKLVSICSKKNKIVSLNYSTLLDYSDLRNILIHNRDDNNEIIAQPTDFTVKNINRIATLIEDEKKALDFSSKPVKIVRPHDTVLSAFELMNKLDTTKIPVYSKNHFINLLTMEMIANWAITKNEDSQVSSAIDCKDCTHKVIFFDENRSLGDVLKVFEDNLAKGNTLSAILITENGANNEYPKGIITAYDLPKIMAYIL